MNVTSYDRAYRVLRECAATRRTIVGSDLARELQTNSPEEFTEILDAISEDCLKNKRPLLTALVVQGTTGIPSRPFFRKYCPPNIADSRRGTRTSIWKHLVKAVYDFYAA